MKTKALLILSMILVLLFTSAVAEDDSEWIVVDVDVQTESVADWDEPDSALQVMMRDDGLIYAEDIDEPLLNFLQTECRCVFETLRPSQLISRLSRITEVDLSGYEGTLEDIRWLWMFDTENLVSLTLTDAVVDDLSVIGDFTALEQLTLLNCGCFDLSPLENCTELTSLTLGWDDEYATAEVFDLTPLASLKNLEAVALYGSGITSLDVLAENPRRYSTLVFSDTAIEDFSELENFTGLDSLTVDLIHASIVIEMLSACPRSIESLTLKQLILTTDLMDTVARFNNLDDYAIIDCDISNDLFYEELNDSSTLTIQSVTMPSGDYIGEIYADKTTMTLHDVPEAIMIAILGDRSSKLDTLDIDIAEMTEELSTALAKKTLIDTLTVNLTADVDLTADAWKRLGELRYMTITSQGYTLANTDFMEELTGIRTLTLSGVEIADTTGIANLKRMTELDAYGSRITDWSFVADLSALTIIKIYGCELQNDSLQYFAAMSDLDELRLDGNEITDLTPLLESETIRKLSVLDNPIEDYTVILDMPAVRMVYLDEGGIITGDYILARSSSYDNIDYDTIWAEAFGTDEDTTEEETAEEEATDEDSIVEDTDTQDAASADTSDNEFLVEDTAE